MGAYNEIDLKFSRDGDLVLGEPLRDDDGNIIYDENGNPIVDLALTEGTEALEQDLWNRIRTNAPEWELHPKIGANLEDIIGEPNTRETGMIGATNIKNTMTFDGRVSLDDIEVRPVPTNYDEITFFVQIYLDNRLRPMLIPIPFNFVKGVMNSAS